MPNVLLTESIAVELGGAEPWPDDAKLFQPPEDEQIILPERANSLAVQALLKISSLSFDVEERCNAEQMSPSGHIPFIKCGSYVISEWDTIISFVNSKGVNISSHLEQAEQADKEAYMSLVDKVFSSAELYISWLHNDTYKEHTAPRFTTPHPWPLNKVLCYAKYRAAKRKLHSVSWASKTFEEVLSEVEDCCQALSERLNNRPYFFGEKPTELDALVYGHLSAILTTPLPDNSLAAIIKEHEKLVALITRMAETYFAIKLSIIG